MRNLEYIRENWETLELGALYDPNRASGKKLVSLRDEPTLLLNFAEGFKRTPEGLGRRIDSYHQNKTNPRRMTTVGTSLQGISRSIRHTICRDTMYDLDIKNAHPILLKNWCDFHGIVCVELYDFNENRQDRFNDVKRVLKCSKDEAKTYILRLTNGGGANGPENWNIIQQLLILDWFLPFFNELEMIRKKVILHYPELLKKAIKAKGKDYYNLDGVTISYLLTNIENQVLQAMVIACMKKRVKIACLIYDGFMIYKEGVNLDEICSYLEQEVKLYTKHVVTIVPKEMDEGLTIPEDYKDSFQRQVQDKEIKQLMKLHEKQQKEQIKKEAKQLEKEYKQQQRELKAEAKEQDEEETDRELAVEFLREYNGKIKYNKDRGQGYFYKEKSKLWIQFINFESLQEEILETLDITEARHLKNVAHMVKIKLMNLQDDLTMFNMVTGIVSLQNGNIFDMKQGITRERVKEDYCSIFLNHEYTEDYNKEWVKQYIGELVGHDDLLVDQLLELVGYSLSAENVLKLVIILIGDGDNGKSLFIEMVQKCMGEYQTMANPKIIKKPKFENNTHEAHLFPLINKRAVFSTELCETDEFNCQALKQISGNDGISIRNSGGTETVSVTLKTVVWIATNVMSKITDSIFGKRLACINFPNTFERSATKADEIKSHAHDLFCAFMDGGHRFYKRNKVIELLPQIKDYTKKINHDQDSCIQYFKENEYEVNKDSKVRSTDLYTSYVDFTREIQFTIYGKETFYKKVEAYFSINKVKDKVGYFFNIIKK
jgi:P4 family phage/plasmid primase-like protien